jgi:hypothetical protein
MSLGWLRGFWPKNMSSTLLQTYWKFLINCTVGKGRRYDCGVFNIFNLLLWPVDEFGAFMKYVMLLVWSYTVPTSSTHQFSYFYITYVYLLLLLYYELIKQYLSYNTQRAQAYTLIFILYLLIFLPDFLFVYPPVYYLLAYYSSLPNASLLGNVTCMQQSSQPLINAGDGRLSVRL